MISGIVRWRIFILAVLVAALGACSAAPQVKRIQILDASADVPYQKILVVALYSKFDSRRYFEQAVVERLTARGVDAIASTSLMNTKTPVTRETFQAMVDDLNADAVLLSQQVSLRSTGKVVDMNPQMTVNLRPTGYYNVFSVETTEYTEPQAVDFEHSLVLMTDMYSVSKRDMVWGIQSSSVVKMTFDRPRDFSVINSEADTIAEYLVRDGLVKR